MKLNHMLYHHHHDNKKKNKINQLEYTSHIHLYTAHTFISGQMMKTFITRKQNKKQKTSEKKVAAVYGGYISSFVILVSFFLAFHFYFRLFFFFWILWLAHSSPRLLLLSLSPSQSSSFFYSLLSFVHLSSVFIFPVFSVWFSHCRSIFFIIVAVVVGQNFMSLWTSQWDINKRKKQQQQQ